MEGGYGGKRSGAERRSSASFNLGAGKIRCQIESLRRSSSTGALAETVAITELQAELTAEGEHQGGGLIDHAIGVPSLAREALYPAVDDALEVMQHLLPDRCLLGALVESFLVKEVL
ncbi:hypothetical protein E2562_003244 [Oryza meyeriana var. granulata]|uniref:Uncharacterized protein n=1 Tax=Oryza meyeriana var. granulata TaxID=110450 RepID=A0A6G1EUV1_9ORYZ|nr:hypothetical protein E2562_003244 [Oryza meyeriana var. granulata]